MSRQAGSLSSAGAQQGAGLARLADCAHWGLVEWHRGGEWRWRGEREVNKRYSGSKTKKHTQPELGRQNHHCFFTSCLFLAALHELMPGDKQKLRHLARCCGHLEIVLSGGDNAILESQSPSPVKSTDMPGACLLISFVFWRLQQNSVGSLAGCQISEPTGAFTGLLEHSKLQR